MEIGISFRLDFYMFVLLFILLAYLFVSVTVTNLHKAYFSFHFLMMFWPLCQIAVKMTDNPQLQLLYVKLAFVDLSLLGIGWLVFAFFLTGHAATLRVRTTVLLALPALLTAACVWINYRGIFVQPIDGEYVSRHYGPLFWGVIAVLFSYLLAPMFLMAKTFRTERNPRMKRPIKLVLIGIVIVTCFAMLDVALNVVFLASPRIIPGLTSVGIFVSAIFFVIGIRRYNMLDIVTIAHQDVIDTIADGILVLDEQERVLEINQSFRHYLDLPLGEQFAVEALLRYPCAEPKKASFLRTYREEPQRVARIDLTTDEAEQRYFSLQTAPIVLHKIRVGRIVTLQDVTEVRRLVNDLERMAITDSLTGCYNRHFLTEHLECDIMRHAESHRPFAIMLLDIDYFKRINDQFGHLAGDEVICCTVKAIRGTLRPSDILARYGGEEFMLYLPDTAPEEASLLAEQIRTAVETNRAAIDNGSCRIPVTVSIGLLSVDTFEFEAGLPSHPNGYIARLLAFVDEALYEAKKNGRNQVVRASPEI